MPSEGKMALRPDHEYALLNGANRSNIGRWISVISAAVSSLVVFVVLAAVDLAKVWGLGPNLPPLILAPLGAGTVYVILYWLFDRHGWKIGHLRALLKLPNLSGQWSCVGQAINPDRSKGIRWEGTVTITQSWDRLKIRLKTKTSESTSLAAAVSNDEGSGYVVLYHYENTPRADAAGLHAHRGFSELKFGTDCRSAEGEYFNGLGRFTFGTMKLEKVDG